MPPTLSYLFYCSDYCCPADSTGQRRASTLQRVTCHCVLADPDARLRERSLTPTSAAALVACSLRCYANVSITPHNLAEDTVRAMQALETPPYAISNANHRMALSSHTIPVSALHYDGTLEYDAHSIYGLSEAVATHAALLELQPGKRPFILTRYRQCPAFLLPFILTRFSGVS
jgi:alpha-glucosidase (family GH31 glycosyl hydrolase)